VESSLLRRQVILNPKLDCEALPQELGRPDPLRLRRRAAAKEGAQSRRDRPIVAWHEVPGTAPPPIEPSVGHGMIGRRPSPGGISCRKVRRFFKEGQSLQSSNRRAYRRESDRTLRDGSFEVALSRHFVPGYGRTVPSGLGQSPFGQQIVSRDIVKCCVSETGASLVEMID
jgi:hypothetical protein